MRNATTLLLLAALSAAPAALAQEWAGTVKGVSGNVSVERAGARIPLSLGSKVFPRDKLLTGKDSQVAVTLRDDTLISTGPNSQLVLREFSFNASTQEGGMLISLLRGVSAMVSGLVAKANPEAMRVSTPTATMGIRGTEFIVEVEGE